MRKKLSKNSIIKNLRDKKYHKFKFSTLKTKEETQ